MDNSRILSLDNREQISRQSMDFVTRPHLNLIYETMTSDLAVCGTAACVVVRSVHKKKTKQKPWWTRNALSDSLKFEINLLKQNM